MFLSRLLRSTTTASTNSVTAVTIIREIIMSTSSSCKDDSDDSSLRVKGSLSDDKEKRRVEQQVSSIHAAHVTDVYQVPIKVIIRPIPSVLDETKVESLMETIQNKEEKHLVPPIDVMWITGSQGGDYYFSFGGCHRFEAHKRLQAETIPCKLIKSTVTDLRIYMGSSTPDLI